MLSSILTGETCAACKNVFKSLVKVACVPWIVNLFYAAVHS